MQSIKDLPVGMAGTILNKKIQDVKFLKDDNNNVIISIEAGDGILIFETNSETIRTKTLINPLKEESKQN